jgi:hypothetical protein
LAAAQSEVKLQSGGPGVAEWERQLDHARRALLAAAPAASDCLDKIEKGAGEVIAVSQAAFARVLEDVPIPFQTRLDAAENSSVADAVAVVRRLMMAPRDLNSRRGRRKWTGSSASRLSSRKLGHQRRRDHRLGRRHHTGNRRRTAPAGQTFGA